ncbi:MAG: YlmC/YmxH family sporulation protein [Firmicutes bacterium]|nr:YlmC/YmxH family sporulation protein [Bacillota bacterium]
MRLSEIGFLELVDLNEGVFLGPVGKSDLLVDEKTGEIKAIISKKNKGFFPWQQRDRELFIPWQDIIKIGKEMVIFKLKQKPYR